MKSWISQTQWQEQQDWVSWQLIGTKEKVHNLHLPLWSILNKRSWSFPRAPQRQKHDKNKPCESSPCLKPKKKRLVWCFPEISQLQGNIPDGRQVLLRRTRLLKAPHQHGKLSRGWKNPNPSQWGCGSRVSNTPPQLEWRRAHLNGGRLGHLLIVVKWLKPELNPSCDTKREGWSLHLKHLGRGPNGRKHPHSYFTLPWVLSVKVSDSLNSNSTASQDKGWKSREASGMVAKRSTWWSTAQHWHCTRTTHTTTLTYHMQMRRRHCTVTSRNFPSRVQVEYWDRADDVLCTVVLILPISVDLLWGTKDGFPTPDGNKEPHDLVLKVEHMKSNTEYMF